ncbi:hypothetical protein COV04_00905 [Candidatus Uhrbacteria bacterium CG10_big_fil_rev_8_21_14_0_10_48_11]|uniref:SbsA Ig-like domain-containing protein n=1 Tax=Candidatus Uhrbacteria bacterium CG10_big_fil_rev_8_21_14_0_10_48_11 TaxID=1975037 RepID=A0A2M8LF65_9BACT|nr:MAG: hypothetical protein COV04_00905 [Candidatus Uhrbacteria bacterium CG10_big_fil_rev_8_21_14_0_10_48_11]
MRIFDAFRSRLRDSLALRRTLKHSFVFIIAIGIVLTPALVFAQGIDTGLTNFANDSGLGAGPGDLRILIARIIRALLGFLGLIAVGVVLYGGYLWMTAGGNSDRVEMAKQVLQNGAIGLVIILLAFSIVSFILNQLLGLGGGGGGGNNPPAPPCVNCFALGNGIVEDHYPARDQRGVPRNTGMAITFREPILVVDAATTAPAESAPLSKSFIKDAVSRGESFNSVACPSTWCGHLNADVFDLQWDPSDGTSYQPFSNFDVYTNDQRTFVFVLQRDKLLGLPDANTMHRATVHSTLTKSDGTPGFVASQTYVWSFEVSTIIDTTPPKVVDIFPWEHDVNARNSVVKVTFNEAINPISATGNTADGFTNIVITATAATNSTSVTGTFSIGNNYRTVEFISSDPCGLNSCNQKMYCLPAASTLQASAKAATLWSDDDSCGLGQDPSNNPSRACTPATESSIFDGVVDMASNSLDGSKNIEHDSVGSPVNDAEGNPLLRMPSGNGTADGPPDDNFVWSFTTNDTIVLIGPEIIDVTPAPELSESAQGVPTDAPIRARFNRELSNLTTYLDQTKNPPVPHAPVRLYQKSNESFAQYPYAFTGKQASVRHCSETGEACAYSTDCVVDTNHPNNRCEKVCSLSEASCLLNKDCKGGNLDFCGQGDASILHSGLEEVTEAGVATHNVYEPRYSSVIRDVYQNCFYPSNGPTATPGTVEKEVDEPYETVDEN